MKRSALRAIADGAATYSEVGRILGISKNAARGRVLRLVRDGLVLSPKRYRHAALRLSGAGRVRTGSAGTIGTVDLGRRCECGAWTFTDECKHQGFFRHE